MPNKTNKIIDELSIIEQQIISGAAKSEKPFLLHMLGIPGAGKTSFLEIFKNIFNEPFVFLGFDQVMQAIPSYQNSPDKIAAFNEMELPAREAGYRILNGLVKQKSSFLFDNGGSNESHPELLKNIRDIHGFKLIFVSITTPINVARQRVDARAISTGQHTPLNYLEERANKLNKLIPIYKELTPHFFEIENNGVNINEYREVCVDTAKKLLLL